MYMVIYNDVDTGQQIVMDESISYNKMLKELSRLISKEDYPCWSLHIINTDDMIPNPNTKAGEYKGFTLIQGTGV